MVIINFSNIYSQEMLSLSKTIVKDNVKMKKLYKELSIWFNSQNSFSNVTDNKEDEFSADCSIPYKNPVKYENSSNLTRIYAQQTEGRINFKIKVTVTDNQCTVVMNAIRHVPGNKSDNIDFGLITVSDMPPVSIVEEVGEKWSIDVWEDMKSQSRKKFEDFVSSIQNNYISAN